MSTKKKSNDKRKATVNPNESLGLVLPTASAPVVPTVLIPIPNHSHAPVLETHVAIAERVAAELESSASYAEDFGSCGPRQEPVITGLRIAHAWSEEQVRAEAWRTYVSRQRETSWSTVMDALVPLLKGFDGAVARDPSILARYPRLAEFVSARKKLGTRAAASRKKKDKAKSAATPATPALPTAPAAATGGTKSAA